VKSDFGICLWNKLGIAGIREFPKLANGGGYELLRAPETGSRELVVIDIPHDGYSVEYLQAVVKSAKVYIWPLQRDLDLTPL
jgi:hypothetical protein